MTAGRNSPGTAPARDAGRVAGSAAADRGAASVLVLAIGLLLVAAGVAAAAVGAAHVARHQARTAADLGALAGAVHAVRGRDVACAVAGRFVTANAARMTACDVDGLEIVVHVEVTATPLAGRAGPARAAARAGPIYAGTE